MIRFERVPEPEGFDEKVRRPGRAWLAVNPETRRIPALWSPFRSHLADGFLHLCAYSALYEPIGCVDHYLSSKNHRHLAYEWSNYRFSSEWVNKSKQAADDQVLDPHEVEDGWFAILLPSLQLVVTDAVPPEQRARAKRTLERLHLRDDERVLRQRQAWYELYQKGHLTLEGLRRMAPLIARAVEAEGPARL
jgi:hypothetical protein